MSNSYINKMRRELRKSGLDYDERDLPARRENLWAAVAFFAFIVGAVGASFFLGPIPAAPPVRRPGSTTETDMVQAVIALLMISPLFYLLFLGLKHAVQVVVRRLARGRGLPPSAVRDVDGHDRRPGDDQ